MLKRIPFEDAPWDELDSFKDRVIFHTRPWLEFLRRTQGAEPVVAAVIIRGQAVGYFTGAIVRRFGLRILGSPLKGWVTPYMGFNLSPGHARSDYLAALAEFAFKDLGCAHLELVDRAMPHQHTLPVGYTQDQYGTHEIDLTQDEEALWANMRRSCRASIRKAESNRLVIEETSDLSFADEYYAQLRAVFAKSTLVPSYSVEVVRELIRCLQPTGNIMLLRVRSPSGNCIATAIFLVFKGFLYSWGSASWPHENRWRPNELVDWYAMQQAKHRAMHTYDLAGLADYKRKFGTRDVTMPHLLRPRYGVMLPMRQVAERIFRMRQKMAALLKAPRSLPD